MPRARRYSCMRSVGATISRSATSPILQRKDREVAGNAGRPQRRLRAEAGGERLRRQPQEGVGIEQVAGQPLHVGGVGERQAAHGASAPASASRTASSGARSSPDGPAAPWSPRPRRASCRRPSRTSPRPSCVAGTRTWRRSDSDRIEHEAGAADKPGAGLKAAGSAIVRPRPMKARRSVSASVARGEPELSSTKCASSMSGFARRALAPAREDHAVVGADLGLARTSSRMPDGRCRRLPAPAPARQRR